MQKGDVTAAAILEATGQLLIENGYAELSMRNVAAQVGISVGNLTYHFRTRSELIHAMVDHLVSPYTDRLAGIATTDQDPAARLRSLVAYLVEESGTRETSRLFRELWAMALHDTAVEAGLARVYESGYAAIRSVLLDLDPTASDATIRAAVSLICLASEGSCVLNSSLYDFIATPEEVVEVTVASVLRLIEEQSAARGS